MGCGLPVPSPPKKFERLDYLNYYHGFWLWMKAMILMTFSLTHFGSRLFWVDAIFRAFKPHVVFHAAA